MAQINETLLFSDPLHSRRLSTQLPQLSGLSGFIQGKALLAILIFMGEADSFWQIILNSEALPLSATDSNHAREAGCNSKIDSTATFCG